MLNLRPGPGAHALLSRADGQLTRVGQHYNPTASKDFDFNQLVRNDSRRREHRLGKSFRDKYCEYLVRGRRRSGGTPARAASAETGCW